jgi:hypothetical protein
MRAGVTTAAINRRSNASCRIGKTYSNKARYTRRRQFYLKRTKSIEKTMHASINWKRNAARGV